MDEKEAEARPLMGTIFLVMSECTMTGMDNVIHCLKCLLIK